MNGTRFSSVLETLMLPAFSYAFTKILISSNNIFATTLRIFITILLVLITITLLAFNFCIYATVHIILKIRFGRKFLGLLNGNDRIWNFESKSKAIINNVYWIESKDKDTPEKLLEFFQERYTHISKTHPRLSSVKETSLGYAYFRKTDFDIAAVVKFMDHYETMEEFQNLLDGYSNEALPLNNHFLWEIYVGKTPLKWQREELHHRQVPVLIRYHHCTGDGIALVTMMTTNLLENGLDSMRNKCSVYENVLKKSKMAKKDRGGGILSGICSLWKRDLVLNILFDREKPNMLHGKYLSGEKYACWALERNEDDFVAKIKRIKNRFGVSFDDVVFACIGSSLKGYYQKYDTKPPFNITAINPYFLSGANLSEILHLKGNEAITNLGNKFSILLLKQPINQTNNASDQLVTINAETSKVKSSLDIVFAQWQLNVLCTLIPNELLKKLVALNDGTIAITNVPGNTTANLLNGMPVRDTICWANNYQSTGITYTLFTYDNLIRLGLLVDKALISDRMEVQNIADNVLKHINLLDQLQPQ